MYTTTYQIPSVIALGEFSCRTGFGIGGAAENWNPIADRKN